MFKFTFLNKNRITSDLIIETIDKIRQGDLTLRDNFIAENKSYIKRTLCKILKRYINDEFTEEFSIGLSAFNEAIEHYDLERRGDFYKYSYLMIYHRIIDFKRRSKRNSRFIPFSSIDDGLFFEEKYLISDSHYQYEKIEIKEEILYFKKRLLEFGISWDDLIANSPKHKDSKSLCIEIAKVIIENKNLYDKFLRTKNLPRSEVLNLIKVHRRTIENHRIFIIALCLILSGDNEELKGFVAHCEEGRK